MNQPHSLLNSIAGLPGDLEASESRLRTPSAATVTTLLALFLMGATGNLAAQDAKASDAKAPATTAAEKQEADPWAENQGWPGQQSINREGGHIWWNTNISEWPQWERGILRAGAMIVDFNTTLSFTVNDAIGLGIDAENALGLESILNTWRIEGEWRFGNTGAGQP